MTIDGGPRLTLTGDTRHGGPVVEKGFDTIKRVYVWINPSPDAGVASGSHRWLGGGLQFPAGLSLTSGLPPFPPGRVSGLAGQLQ